MGYVYCRSCSGSGIKSVWRDGNKYQMAGFKTFPCKACGGSGINHNLYSKNCEKCGTEIVYPRDASFSPRFCKSCKEVMQREKELNAAKWKETRCKICGMVIKYNTDWAKIPDTCKPCIEKQKAKWKETRCKVCGATIKYNTDWSKIPDKCKPCIEKDKAKWKERRCKICGTNFNYNTDWSKIPDTCKPCIDKEKKKWSKVKCKWCRSEFEINSDWSNPPELCKQCLQKIKDGQEEKATIWRRFRRYHDPIELPIKVIWNRHDTDDTAHHLTIKYSDGYRISWEATKYGDFNFHWTNENLDRSHPDRHRPPEDATVV